MHLLIGWRLDCCNGLDLDKTEGCPKGQPVLYGAATAGIASPSGWCSATDYRETQGCVHWSISACHFGTLIYNSGLILIVLLLSLVDD